MAIKIAILLVSAGCAGWLALQLYRLVSTVIAARQNLKNMKDSADHPASIRLSVEAQTQLMQTDIRLGVMFGIALLLLIIGIVGELRAIAAGGS